MTVKELDTEMAARGYPPNDNQPNQNYGRRK